MLEKKQQLTNEQHEMQYAAERAAMLQKDHTLNLAKWHELSGYAKKVYIEQNELNHEIGEVQLPHPADILRNSETEAERARTKTEKPKMTDTDKAAIIAKGKDRKEEAKNPNTTNAAKKANEMQTNRVKKEVQKKAVKKSK